MRKFLTCLSKSISKLHAEEDIILFIAQCRKNEDIYLQSIFDSPFLSHLIISYLSYGLLLNAVPEISIPIPRKVSRNSEGEGGELVKLKIPKGWLSEGGEGGGRANQKHYVRSMDISEVLNIPLLNPLQQFFSLHLMS